MNTGTVVPGLLVALAFALASRRHPGTALALLLVVIAPFSSLAWQLGGANLALPWLALCGFTLGRLSDGAFWKALRHVDRWQVAASMAATVVLAGALAHGLLESDLPAGGFGRSGALAPQVLGEVVLQHAAGAAGALQDGLLLICAALLPTAIVTIIREPGRHDGIFIAAVAGLALVAAGPAMQYALGLDTGAWADRGVVGTTGIAGFSQDANSYAAALLMALAVCVAAASNRWQAGRYWPALAMAIGAGGVVWLVILTGRRSALISMIPVAALSLGLMVVASGADVSTRLTTARRLLAVALIGAVVLAASVLLLGDWLERSMHGYVAHLGNPRAWQVISPDRELTDLSGDRLSLWGAALRTIANRPLWGTGADGFRNRISPPLSVTPHNGPPTRDAHNYYLQLAAEMGVPAALAMAFLLVRLLCLSGSAMLAAPDITARALAALAISCSSGVLLLSLAAHPLLLAENVVLFGYWLTVGIPAKRREWNPGSREPGDDGSAVARDP